MSGGNVTIYTCQINSPYGDITASARDDALNGLWFVGQKYYPNKTNNWVHEPHHSVFKALRIWLEAYFAGEECKWKLALAPEGTEFQQAVWNILLQIPYGQVTTYGEIAKKIATLQKLPSMSAQAVGGAVGRNHISLVIPCHRVIGSNKDLTGSAWGLDRKKALLELEGVDFSKSSYKL